MGLYACSNEVVRRCPELVLVSRISCWGDNSLIPICPVLPQPTHLSKISLLLHVGTNHLESFLMHEEQRNALPF